jgi:hypothetical protein
VLRIGELGQATCWFERNRSASPAGPQCSRTPAVTGTFQPKPSNIKQVRYRQVVRKNGVIRGGRVCSKNGRPKARRYRPTR